ncbi:MAG TPA: arginine deiminase, partial [Clostridiaceae bacterium]|nr:arginine deiminase [Clostridiaceae bacterium]
MGETFLNITSEIGKLKAVLLHRPSREVENLVPEYLERLLFDDIPYLKIAQQEHDAFAKVLQDNGAHVYYIENMLEDVLADRAIRNSFINVFLDESNISGKSVRPVLEEYLSSLDTKELVCMLIAGVRKKDMPEDMQNKLPEASDSSYIFYIDPMPNLYFTRDIG